MKRILASFILIAAVASLSGCYYDPGYNYVRGSGSGYGGDAYYGQGAATYYAAPGYYDGYYPGYYGSGYYGCCDTPNVGIGVSSGWYGGSRYDRPERRGGYRDDHRGEYRGPAPQQRSGVREQARPSVSRGGGHRDGGHHNGEDRRSHSGDHRN